MKNQSRINKKAPVSGGEDQPQSGGRNLNRANCLDRSNRASGECCKELSLDIPGVLAGRVFDVMGVLWFIAETIFHSDQTIEAALAAKATNQPRFKSKNFIAHWTSERLRSLIQWRQVALL